MKRWWGETAGGLPRTFWYLWTGTLIGGVAAELSYVEPARPLEVVGA